MKLAVAQPMKPTLSDLESELALGRVYEGNLHDPVWHLDGIQVGQSVYIDPRPAVLESLLHELLHRRYPQMGERAVTATARRLVASMDDAVKARWWRAYQRIKKKGRPLRVE